jgi:predicted O-methyltransferase YrrM
LLQSVPMVLSVLMKSLLRRLIQDSHALNQLIFVAGAVRGHFYSPIPSLKELRADRQRVFGELPREIPGVDLREPQQLELLCIMQGFYAQQPFNDERSDGMQYSFQNDQFCHCDAIMLYGMLRHSRPRRLIEVGSGHSSAAIADTSRLFLNNSVECTFIDPNPQRLKAVLAPSTPATILEKRVQDVPLDLFASLEAGDILFIDSAHVAKTGSDVNHIFFRILPILKPGVRVHLHDVVYPFEYPEEWVFDGKAWNEAYILRAFLQYNSKFELELFPSYLIQFHREYFQREMPLCLQNTGGSIWIRRTG